MADDLRTLVQRRPLLADGLLALALAAVTIAGAAVTASQPGQHRLTYGAAAWLAATTLPLVWRRRAPVAVLVVAGLAATVFGVRDYPDPVAMLGPLAALESVLVHSRRRDATVAGVLTLVCSVGATLAAGDSDGRDYYVAVISVVAAWALGEHQRDRNARRAEDAAAAVEAERARIARELHDVVAHHVSLMVVQAEAGGAVTADPSTFDAIASTGRQALTELRRLLGVLRDDLHESPVAPQPGLDDLGDLVGRLQASGLVAEVHVEGRVRPVPAGVSLNAYRIVQEALTNVVRHAGPARATVSVRYLDDAVGVEVADDGGGAGGGPPTPNGRGHGLLGIRERVELFGGQLEAGPQPGGGFAVRARLPTRG